MQCNKKIVLCFFYSYFILLLFHAIGEFRTIIPDNNWFLDWDIYIWAINRFNLGDGLYNLGFIYFPSFLLLQPLFYNYTIYFFFLLICCVISFIILIKIDSMIIAFLFFIISLLFLHSGNIDPFIFLVLLLCILLLNNNKELLNKKKILLNNIMVCFLLAFISFKQSIILIFPYFMYRLRDSLSKCIFFYGLFFILFNFYFILYPNLIIEFWNYAIGCFDHKFELFRPFWVVYIYYYWLLNSKFK